MDARVNERQMEVLKWVVQGCPEGRWERGDYQYKTTAIALQNRRLVKVQKTSKAWTCTATEAGVYYAENGTYPEDHLLSQVTRRPAYKPEVAQPPKKREPKSRSKPQAEEQAPEPLRRPEPEWEVDSPKRLAAKGNSARTEATDDAWQERILISVKQAAWLLDMSQETVRRAVSNGDMQRVWIGEGTTNYRIVYDSLLAWVDSMPREPRPSHYAFWDNNRRWP